MTQSLHILVVDDEPLVRSALTRILEGLGHTVCSAGSAENALVSMRSEKPDVILLDIVLRGTRSGWDLARDKLLDPKLRKIPLFVLSGLSPEEVRQGARDFSDAMAGTILLLHKPEDMTTEGLAAALKHVVKAEPSHAGR